MKYLSLILIIPGIFLLTALIFVGVVLGSFFIKKHTFKMTSETWDLYFKNLSDKDVLVRFWALILIALSMACFFGYFIFIAMNFMYPLALTIVTFLLGVLRILFSFKKHGSEFLKKVHKIREE
ncbi:MAG: hypothetical protein ATN32_10450 [Candidatus Epulonipiscium fishelsonii]|nr:MAG: hypothetical protein ATN32_10450 [Epulopiscium sp. AS2M-Bin002]